MIYWKKLKKKAPGFSFGDQYEANGGKERHMTCEVIVPLKYEPAKWVAWETDKLTGIYIPLVQDVVVIDRVYSDE